MPSSSFLECRRCSSFLLKSTSTAKRVHQANCLKGKLFRSKISSCSKPQLDLQYERKFFPATFIKLNKLSGQDVRRVQQELRASLKIKNCENESEKAVADPPVKKRRGRKRGKVLPDANLIIQSGRVRKSLLNAREKILGMRKRDSSDEDDEVCEEITASKNRRKDTLDPPYKFTEKTAKSGQGNQATQSERMKRNHHFLDGKDPSPKCSSPINPLPNNRLRSQFRGNGRQSFKYCRQCTGYKCFLLPEYFEQHKIHFHDKKHDSTNCSCDITAITPRTSNHCYQYNYPKYPKYENKPKDLKRSSSVTNDRHRSQFRETENAKKRFKYCKLCVGLLQPEYFEQHKLHFHSKPEDHDPGTCTCDLDKLKARPRHQCYKYIYNPETAGLGSGRPGIPRNFTKRRRNKKLIPCHVCDGYVKSDFIEQHKAHFHSIKCEADSKQIVEDHQNNRCACDLLNCVSRRWNECYKKIPKQRLVECLICGKFVTKENIMAHLDKIHIMDPKLKSTLEKNNCLELTCIFCNQTCQRYHQLKSHFVHSHMIKNPFVCKILGCRAKFGSYFELESHVMNHVEESKVECEICKKLYSLEKLNVHQLNGRCKNPEAYKEKLNSQQMQGRSQSKNNSRMVSIWSLKAKMQENNEGVTRRTFEQVQNVSVKTVELESINLVDRIVKKEHEAVHVNGEVLEPQTVIKQEVHDNEEATPTPEAEMKPGLSREEKNTDLLLEEMYWDVESIENLLSLPKVEESQNNPKLTLVEIKTIVIQFLLSCNSKIRSAVYLNSLIREDPVFKKLEKEDPKRAHCIVRVLKKDTDYFTPTFQPYGLENLFECDKCHKGFRRIYALQKHKRISFLCHDKAQAPGIEEDANESEINNGNGENGDDPSRRVASSSNNALKLTCGDCGFYTHSSLEMRKHTEKCSVHLHNKAYFAKRKHKCTHRGCGSLFLSKERLFKHVQEVHNAERKVKCNQCEKAFTKLFYLKRHETTHEHPQLKFRCNLCKRRYSEEEVWKKHVKMCRKRRPECSQCNERFSNPYGLRRHVLVVHATNPNYDNDDKAEGEENVINHSTLKELPDHEEKDDQKDVILGF